MMPKRSRSLLPLFLFFLLLLSSFAAFSLFSTSSSSTTSLRSSLNPIPDPSFSLTIKLLTYDRIASLQRCLRSLAAADYAGDRVRLHIFLDHFPISPSANGSQVIEEKLQASRRILDFVDAFQWRHGEKVIHYRTSNAGLQAQWLEAWWPASDHDFAFVVEDDLELSPLYFRFLKALILTYYYDQSNYDPSVYGASLQRPRFVAGKHGNKLHLGSETQVFFYQMVGTWGQLLFPKPWKEFRLWYDVHKTKDIKPILQGMVTTGWYKRFGERIWTPWFIKFIHSRGYYNIYTNFMNERALSISHRDAGVNYGKTAGPDSALLDEKSIDFNLWELPPKRNLKFFDYCFREVFPGRIARSLNEVGAIVGSSEKQKGIILINMYQTAYKIARNLICNLEKLGLRNFIILSEDSEFLNDLARRGYPVIDANGLIYSMRSDKMMRFEHSEGVLIQHMLVEVSIVKKYLELGYSLWLTNGNMIPLSTPLPQLPDQSYDFMATTNMQLMFVKNSPSSLKIWVDDYISEVAAVAKSLVNANSELVDGNSFVHVAAKVLERRKDARLWRLDESNLGVNLDASESKESSSLGKMNFIFWPQKMEVESVQRSLESLGIWSIDDDYSCTAVVCQEQ